MYNIITDTVGGHRVRDVLQGPANYTHIVYRYTIIMYIISIITFTRIYNRNAVMSAAVIIEISQYDFNNNITQSVVFCNNVVSRGYNRRAKQTDTGSVSVRSNIKRMLIIFEYGFVYSMQLHFEHVIRFMRRPSY